MNRIIALVALGLGLCLLAAGCKSSGGSPDTSAASSAGARVSAAASQIPQADIDLAKADIKRCITGTPLRQIHTVHVLLLERASGKNGAEVKATRVRVFGCLGVPAGQQTRFKNDSLTAAEKQHPRVWTKAGIKQYVLVTWPGLLARYQHASPSPSGAAS